MINYWSDYPIAPRDNVWNDTQTNAFGGGDKLYVVQTATKVIERCLLMATNPGDLVLDPTCGGGTTAYCAEKWGRRWITIDTSRVALALARRRLMTNQFPYWFVQDSERGAVEARRLGLMDQVRQGPYGGKVTGGFVVKTVPHVTLRSIAQNQEIDGIAARHAPAIGAALQDVRLSLGRSDLEEWEVPRVDNTKPSSADDSLRVYWAARLARQRDMDESIRRNSGKEKLQDQPYEDKKRVRVAGPFTVETLREYAPAESTSTEPEDLPRSETIRHDDPDAADVFVRRVLAAVRVEGLNNPADKSARVTFEEVDVDDNPDLHARATYRDEDNQEIFTGILVGPETGPVTVEAIRRAASACRKGQTPADVLFVLGFIFPPEMGDKGFRLGRVTIYPVRLSQELMMTDLKLSEKGGLFTLYGDPDVQVSREGENIRLTLRGMEVYNPLKRAVVSHAVNIADSPEAAEETDVTDDPADDIACWFVDPDYDGRIFRIRQAYFLGTERPYARLAASLGKKDVLGGPVDPDKWSQIYSATSIAFPRPKGGRVAVKAISHTGDEVLRVIRL